ncbi:MAG: hypothetical protein QGI83_08710 [Candidatus Latescibacteria bacterium]|jgi:hypothetical protein|nr:hypothetical protein [Candidatus Latescibacterota bacterium]
MNKKRAAAIAGVMFYLHQEAQERGDESVRMGMRRLHGWSVYGRKAVARGRLMVQGRRARKSLRQWKRQTLRPGVKKNAPLQA